MKELGIGKACIFCGFPAEMSYTKTYSFEDALRVVHQVIAAGQDEQRLAVGALRRAYRLARDEVGEICEAGIEAFEDGSRRGSRRNGHARWQDFSLGHRTLLLRLGNLGA